MTIVEIIEDRAALEMGLRVIMSAAEKGKLPEECLLPTFNDSMTEEQFKRVIETVVGKRYE